MNKLVQDLLDNLPDGAKVEIKDGWFWNLLGFLVKIFTFGSNKVFNTKYTTTIGNRIAMPVSVWDSRITDPWGFYEILVHELTHVRQQKKYGFGSVWLGAVIQSLLYLLLPLPMGFAYFRYKFESEAYIEGFKGSWKFVKNAGDINTPIEEIRKNFVNFTYTQLTGGGYGYAMWFCKTWVKRDLVKRFYAVSLSDL